MERRTEITLLGDSILKGIQVDPKTRGYQVRNDIGIPELEAEFGLHVRNDAHFGATCVKGAKLLDRLLASGRPCQAVVMDFGGNDCDFRWQDIAADPAGAHLPAVPLPEFRERYRGMVRRLREAGMKVYGMGEKKTPKPFIVACDKFVYIEVIRAAAQQAAQQEKESVPQKSSKKSSKKAAQQAVSAPAASAVPQDMVELIADSLENLCDEDGYTLMGKLSNLLMKKQPDFDPRNYGFSKLSKMIKSLDRFEVDVRQVGDNNTDIYVRDKQGKDK